MITVLIITYKASTYYQSAPVYKEEKFFYQPFTQEYENNFKKTKTENQLQEHEQSIGRPEVIQENITYDKQHNLVVLRIQNVMVNNSLNYY